MTGITLPNGGFFRGKYKYLSNFFIEPDGTHVEGEFQWAKAVDPTERYCLYGMNPWAAKRYGHSIKIRPDWDEVKLDVMYEFVSKKFMDHPDLLRQLLETGPYDLIENNTHGDFYWGVCGGSGQNHLGKILMRVREELK